MPVALPRAMAKKEAEALGRIVGAGEALVMSVEDMEHFLDDVLGTLARVEAKRGWLQGEIAATSRGRRQRAPRQNRRAAPAAAAAERDAQPVAPAPVAYTRKRLRAAAGKAKEEKGRLEALWGELQEAIADARQRVPLVLPPREVA